MVAARGEFGSRFGFVMAAAGSAVGLGNIWGFPTQAASNGGAAFLFVYLLLAFLLAYPALMAELTIGRHGHANAVTALAGIGGGSATKALGKGVGLYGIIIASLILCFYTIVAGWMIAHLVAPLASSFGADAVASWSVKFSLGRNLLYSSVFMLLTTGIISGGVQDGIEHWCSRLMPTLLIMMVLLILYVLTLDGALEGLEKYLVPDFSMALSPNLIISALGQAFFSMSLGVGTMLIYASYLPDEARLPALGGIVTLVDIGIAVLAGFLVIPAMYVAMHNGVQIFSEAGELLSDDTLIFVVLPALFDTMGAAGVVAAIVFFALMTIAALTSSISMLEVPVAFVVETYGLARRKAAIIIGLLILAGSSVILLNFSALFGLVIAFTTRYSQPMLGLAMCVFAGWIWHRNGVLEELRKGDPGIESSLFWRIWPAYIRFVCPLMILLIFAHVILN